MRESNPSAQLFAWPAHLTVVIAMVAASLLFAPVSALALTGVIHVNKASASCSDTGPGTVAVPFCSISAAVDKASPGATVLVEAGTYNEKVNVGKSGTSSAPIVIKPATGATVKVSSPANGFTVSGQSWVTIQGFKIVDPVGYGVNLSGASHITVSGNTVSGAGKPVAGSTKYGILVKNTTDSTIIGNDTHANTDAGIALTLSSTNDVVSGNVTYGNARQFERAAPGIDVRASGNTLSGNTSHNNEDSGIQFYNGASNNVAVNNVVYGNGDHGIDLLSSPGNTLVSNSIYGNTVSGVTMETGSTGTTLRNNIIADNGVGQRGDIWADSFSTSGTTLDYDLVNQSGTGSMITWSGTKYASTSAFASATTFESHGLQGDPKWSNVATGDFHLLAGSPAIDAADSSVPQETPADMSGVARVDDPNTTNTGAGTRAYDDRGALEFKPPASDAPPVPALVVTPATGTVPLQVTADASGSTDADATPIATYTFNFGDGTPVVGPQAGSSAPHTYNTAGTWTVTVTVTDTAAKHAETSKQVTSSAAAVEYVTNPGFETNLTGWTRSGTVSVLARVSATPHTGTYSARLSNPSSNQTACALIDSPNWVTTSAAGTYTASMWVKAPTAGATLKLTLDEQNGSTAVGSKTTSITLSTTWQQVSVNYTPSQPGVSTIGFTASVAKAPTGVCFYADDASIKR